MSNTPIKQPKTIDELMKILAYNEWAWIGVDGIKHLHHPKDRSTVVSLAESQYAWTEKQANLALSICKRYSTKFEKYGLKVRDLITNPVYENPFRIIHAEKIIEIGEEIFEDGQSEEIITMKFPFIEKIVKLIRCCKDKKRLPQGYMLFSGESKIWTIKKTEVTTYYMTMIAIRYNFSFASEQLLDEYEEIKKIKCQTKQPSAYIHKENMTFKNVSESFLNYWQKNITNKKLLVQLDKLKNFAINQKKLKVKAYSEVGKRIAHNHNTSFWVDKASFNKDELLIGLKELDCFPILMPVTGEITDNCDEVNDLKDWIKAFERQGIDRHKNISWGFELKEPKEFKDMNPDEKWLRNFDRTPKFSVEDFQRAYDLYQESKNFKHIDKNTMVYFVRNRLPRSLMRANIKFGCGVVAIGGGYYATGGENIKRLLDKLPKKLYYSDAQPTSYEWQSRAIKKL